MSSQLKTPRAWITWTVLSAAIALTVLALYLLPNF
jgi:hypothetical protein